MTLSELIERTSRRPLAELLTEGAHLKFSEDEYAKGYCDRNCPYEYAEYNWECPGGCREWDEGIKASQRKVYAGDLLIGEVLRKGYETLGVEGVNEPFTPDWDSGYAYTDWEDAYKEDEGICAECEYFNTSECPEDILSAECPRSGKAWAIERITEAVNEVIA